MKPTELARWMKQHGKEPIDVAAYAKVDTRTVERFLESVGTPRKIFVEALDRMVKEYAEESDPKRMGLG